MNREAARDDAAASALPQEPPNAYGAHLSGTGCRFHVWAPDHAAVSVVIDGQRHPLQCGPDGTHSGAVAGVVAGARYGFAFGDGEQVLPDPASRWQPDGPHGLSAVVDPTTFAWTDAGWRGIALPGQVIMEIHVGTFTEAGTWAAAAERLPDLVDIGVTVIEMMPVNDFPGRFGWGYDGVGLYAPVALYGEPDDLRRFVDRAHALGLGVILDVVYNHLGPDGNFLPQFGKSIFHDRRNDWGDVLNFDEGDVAAIRRFFIDNGAYWIREFHFDGLRLDATQEIHDASPVHVIAEIAAAARAAAGERSIILVAENEPQDSRLLAPAAESGCALDALWNDDFHHAAHVALTGRREAYYSDYDGSAREIADCLAFGFLMQGQRSSWQKNPRGTPVLRTPPMRFVSFLENHDQVANSGDGRRISALAQPARLRALTAVMLLGPQTPMLWQGQEFAASTPFLFFADHGGAVGEGARKGRREFLTQFPSLIGADLDDPLREETFRRCRLDWRERDRNVRSVALHRDLLRLRREDPVLRLQGTAGVLASSERDLAVVRLLGETAADDRLIVVNLGPDAAPPVSMPLIAPPDRNGWRLLWSSEDPAYGGGGTPAEPFSAGWRIPGNSTLLFAGASTR
jgi:maltooligosyltrehalose trehalohydrolase